MEMKATNNLVSRKILNLSLNNDVILILTYILRLKNIYICEKGTTFRILSIHNISIGLM